MLPGRSRRRLLVAVAASAAVCALPAAAHAASPALPTVTISPLYGTPDASPGSQISFLGVRAADLSDISVRGSRSGAHSGKLEAYSQGDGASFVPARPFTPGEHVNVTATETVDGHHATIGTTFAVGYLYTIPAAKPSTPSTTPPPTPPAGTVDDFVTLPSMHPPVVTITQQAADPALGDVFLTPVDGPSQNGAMIVNPNGQLVWFAPAPAGEQATDLRVQEYEGEPVLTYWQGRVVLGHGIGEGIIDNTAYQTIAHVQAGNGLSMDLHDFDLEPNGTALITVYEPVYWNLSAAGGPAKGIIEDCVIQEIDVKTGLVMFEWHALGHVPLTASYSKPYESSGAVWDWFHINSIDEEPDGNFLISSRNTWAIYQIGHTWGEVLWRLGGRESSFALGPGVRFAWQHDATMLSNGSIEVFDNEDDPEIERASRAIDVGLDFKTHKATLLHTYANPKQPVLSASQGDVQQLGNADELVGWGQVGLVSQFSSSDALTFQLELPAKVESYRAYRFPWVATPAAAPLAAVVAPAAGATTTTVAASWNGATDVASWQVLAGASPTTLAPVGGPTASAGFETQISAPATAAYVAVQALSASGQVLGTSTPVAVPS